MRRAPHHLKRAANRFCALAHADHSVAGPLHALRVADTRAIVLDRENRGMRGPPHVDTGARGTRMPRDVRESLLRDPEERKLHLRPRPGAPVPRDGETNSGAIRELLRVPL